jgi:hypothetical protein
MLIGELSESSYKLISNKKRKKTIQVSISAGIENKHNQFSFLCSKHFMFFHTLHVLSPFFFMHFKLINSTLHDSLLVLLKNFQVSINNWG